MGFGCAAVAATGVVFEDSPLVGQFMKESKGESASTEEAKSRAVNAHRGVLSDEDSMMFFCTRCLKSIE